MALHSASMEIMKFPVSNLTSFLPCAVVSVFCETSSYMSQTIEAQLVGYRANVAPLKLRSMQQ